MLLKFIIILTVFAILAWGVEKLLRKRLNIKKDNGYRYVNATHKNIEIALIVIYLFIIFFTKHFIQILIPFLILQFIIRAFFEWKYEKEKREYLMTLFSIIYIPVFLMAAIYLSKSWGVFG